MIDLKVRDLGMRFGGNQVLAGVTFHITEPMICGLIGPNGAGKSTLTNVLDGLYQPTAGAVLLRGERIDGLPPYAIARLGLGRTFQVPRAFKRMTVMDNLLVPGHIRDGGLRVLPATRKRAREALAMLGIEHLAGEYARVLSGGQQKLLELARLVMLQPSIWILDEPLAGVHPSLRERIAAFIRDLREEGKAIVIIEHDMEAIFALSQRLLVLHEGRLIADGEPQLVRRDPAVISAYLGSDDDA